MSVFVADSLDRKNAKTHLNPSPIGPCAISKKTKAHVPLVSAATKTQKDDDTHASLEKKILSRVDRRRGNQERKHPILYLLGTPTALMDLKNTSNKRTSNRERVSGLSY